MTEPAPRVRRRGSDAALAVARRAGPYLLAAAGAGALVLLVAWSGAAEVARTLTRAGWLIVPLCALHLAPLAVDAWAWRILTPPPRPAWATFVVARWIREGVNALLPAAQVGGEVIAVRLLTPKGGAAAKSATVVGLDLVSEFFAMVVAGVAGAALLLAIAHGRERPGAVAVALTMVPAAALALALLGLGRIGVVGRLAGWVASRWPKIAGPLREAQETAREIATRPAALLGSVALHTLGWIGGAAETWVVLAVFGHPLRFEQAFALETTTEVLRGFGFAIPGLLGVQEGSLVLVGALVGLAPAEAIALSLFRRARDVLFGIPSLLAWRLVEARRAGRRRAGSALDTATPGP